MPRLEEIALLLAIVGVVVVGVLPFSLGLAGKINERSLRNRRGRNDPLRCRSPGWLVAALMMAFMQPVSSARLSNRRAKGALAMVVATQYPEGEGRGGHKESSAAEHFPMVKPGRLFEARTVLTYAPELVDLAIAGSKSLDAAYQKPADF